MAPGITFKQSHPATPFGSDVGNRNKGVARPSNKMNSRFTKHVYGRETRRGGISL